ncbi:MAG: IclR family transcriptional regulator [Rhodobacteraceae bacterium]|jgi:DNA-binding IclR family transcriptional regulator|nr:IclR family transcriptional regulator [Paracoccaceae bacterium]
METKRDEGARGGTRPLSSSLRTLAMLDEIASFNRPVRFAELARKIGGSRATNFQKLITLVEAGWVEPNAAGEYQLTLHAARVGSIAFNQVGLGKRMHPIMEQLSAELGESVSLVVLDKDALYIIEEVLTQDLLRVSYRVGTTMRITDTASGRIFAAFISDRHRQDLVAAGTVLPDAEIIAAVRRDHYATSHRAEKSDILAVGVPVFDAQQRIIAVLSIAGPYDRVNVAAARPALMRATSRFMTETGGWKPWGDAWD